MYATNSGLGLGPGRVALIALSVSMISWPVVFLRLSESISALASQVSMILAEPSLTGRLLPPKC